MSDSFFGPAWVDVDEWRDAPAIRFLFFDSS